MRPVSILVASVLSAAVLAAASSVAPPAQSAPAYGALTGTQQRLLDGLAPRPRAGATPGPSPQAIFDGAEASFREAFVKVTTALAAVSLSDHENGEILGVALDLVDGVEPLDRQPSRGGDDVAARLQVTLASGAIDRLRRSSEFERETGRAAGAVSTVYVRQGLPSIWFTAANGTATIEVR